MRGILVLWGCWGLEQRVKGDNPRGTSGLELRSRIWQVGRLQPRLTAPTHLCPHHAGCASLEPEKGTCPVCWP